MGFNGRKLLAGLAVIAVLVKLFNGGMFSCVEHNEGNGNESGRYGKGGEGITITEQDLDNIEFYYEMQNKWENMR